MSPQQLSNRRTWASRNIEATFATTITLGGHEIPAARFHSKAAVHGELAGFLPMADISIRVRRDAIPEGVVIALGRTQLIEGGKAYRIEEMSEANGDPAILLTCKAI